MLRNIKLALAPSTASSAIQKYWSGNHGKALKLFERAHQWWPQLFIDKPVLQGYFGLSYFKIGHYEQALPLLQSAYTSLESGKTGSIIDSAITTSLLAELREALSESTPNQSFNRTLPL